MIYQKRLLLIAVLFLVAGCTMYHVPNPSEPIGPIDDFLTSNTVSLINVQDQAKEEIFLRCMGDKYTGKLHVWTDSAIQIARLALEQRGMKIVDKAPMTLSLSIESAEGFIGGFRKSCETTLMVETGDGYRRTYFGRHDAALVWGCLEIFKAADYAVADAVTQMLRDEKIVKYLTGK